MGQWNYRSFDIGQLITLTASMQIIIETADWDALGGHWVEGGFDKFSVTNAPNILDNVINPDGNKKLIKVKYLFGRETNKISNSVLFYIYDDGSVDKRFIVK